MKRKLQLCVKCSQVVLLGLTTSLLTILILFSISTNWYEQNSNSKQPISPIRMQKTLPRTFKFKHPSATESNFSLWTVIPNNVVVHLGTHPNPHNFTYTLNNSAICETFDKTRIRLLIFIESHTDNYNRRRQIRNTWGVRMLQTALNFRILFLLGQPTVNRTQDLIEQEYFLYGDILQEDFPDTFNNLGLKSVMGLKWSSKYCRHANYIMKTDDDIFVHVPNLLKILSFQNRQSILICHRNRVRKIIRKNSLFGKYEVRSKDLPGIYFPEYCAGFAYIMSLDTADKLYEASLRTPYFFIEDVFITGFCRYKANIQLIDHSAVTLSPRLTPTQTSCAFADGRITSHELMDNGLAMLWEQLNTQGFFCPQPIR